MGQISQFAKDVVQAVSSAVGTAVPLCRVPEPLKERERKGLVQDNEGVLSGTLLERAVEKRKAPRDGHLA